MARTPEQEESARALGKRVESLRHERGWTQPELAARAGVSAGYVSRLEAGEYLRPSFDRLQRFARAFGHASVEGMLGSIAAMAADFPRSGDPVPPPAALNVVGRVEDVRSASARPLPVYASGTSGDPRDGGAAPDPLHMEFAPLGKDLLIGPRGFGVLVRGSSMANQGIYDGDTAWVNPDRPYRLGGPVCARVWDGRDEDVGLVVKLLRRADNGARLWNDEADGESGKRAIACSRFEVIGPVVGVTSWRVPGRRAD